jgi:hypothetical protein
MGTVVQLFPLTPCKMEIIDDQAAAKRAVANIAESSAKLGRVVRDLVRSLDALDQSVDEIADAEARYEFRKSTKFQREALISATLTLTIQVEKLRRQLRPLWEKSSGVAPNFP